MGVIHLILDCLVKIVRKRIAARLAQVGIYAVGEICSLKGPDTLVSTVYLVYLVAYVLLGGNAAESVLKEELYPDRIRKARREVILHYRAYGVASVKLTENVK